MLQMADLCGAATKEGHAFGVRTQPSVHRTEGALQSVLHGRKRAKVWCHRPAQDTGGYRLTRRLHDSWAGPDRSGSCIHDVRAANGMLRTRPSSVQVPTTREASPCRRQVAVNG